MGIIMYLYFPDDYDNINSRCCIHRRLRETSETT